MSAAGRRDVPGPEVSGANDHTAARVQEGPDALGVAKAAARGQSGERYLLGGQNLSVPEFARLIGDVIGVPAPTLVLPRASVRPLAAVVGLANWVSPWPLPVTGDLIRLGAEPFYFDPSKAIRELGLPQTPLRQVIQEAFDWLRAHGYLQ